MKKSILKNKKKISNIWKIIVSIISLFIYIYKYNVQFFGELKIY